MHDSRKTNIKRLAVVVAGCLGLLYRVEPCFSGDEPKNWSIGILKGSRIDALAEDLQCPNPRFTAADVTDRKVDFVADPFLVRDGKKWLLFFEQFDRDGQRGQIGVAVSSDLCRWRYQGIALAEPFHLSYPFVFKVGDTFYMVPESRAVQEVRLYKATSFPLSWRHIRTLVVGNYADSSLALFKSRWWIFTNRSPYGLAIFSARSLTDTFVEHPRSVLFNEDKSRARPGGRPVVSDGSLIRFTQDNRLGYGRRLRAVKVTTLSEREYEEELLMPDPFIANDRPWNSFGIHQLSPVQLSDGSWVAAIDGNTANSP